MKLRRLFSVKQHSMPATCSNVASGREAWESSFKLDTSFSKLLTP